jgi:hypothetical protein
MLCTSITSNVILYNDDVATDIYMFICVRTRSFACVCVCDEIVGYDTRDKSFLIARALFYVAVVVVVIIIIITMLLRATYFSFRYFFIIIISFRFAYAQTAVTFQGSSQIRWPDRGGPKKGRPIPL